MTSGSALGTYMNPLFANSGMKTSSVSANSWNFFLKKSAVTESFLWTTTAGTISISVSSIECERRYYAN